MDTNFEQWLGELDRKNGEFYSRQAEALFGAALASDDSQFRLSHMEKSHRTFARLRSLFPTNNAYLFNAGVTAHCLADYLTAVECFCGVDFSCFSM